MLKFLMALLALTLSIGTAFAAAPVYPDSFKIRDITTNGVTIHVRTGGTGPAVVLLHGHGETGDMWVPLAIDLAKNHTVIIPDLRGMGLSSHPAGGYDKKTQAEDIAGLLAALRIDRADLVTHDIGNMVGFAFATNHPNQVTRFVIMDAPVPGIGPWDEIVKNPLLWHFRFSGPDIERLVAGRERIYLDRFWNEFAFDPSKIDEATRQHYAALYALPGAMHSDFLQFGAFDQDAADNRAWLATGARLNMPILAIGGDHSFGLTMAEVMKFAATNVEGRSVANSGHWLMDEQPEVTVKLIHDFLAVKP